MYVFSFTKKKIKRLLYAVLLLLAGAVIGIYAVISCVDVGAAEEKLPIYSVDCGEEKKIALTFDAAWGNSDTQHLLDTLEARGVKATFFVTGEWADKYPEDVKRLFDSGHEIANHSDAHPHPNELGISELISDTRACRNKIEKITGKTPELYRAPYGEYNDTVVETVNGMGYSFVQWSVDSLDWKDPTPDEIVKRVVRKAHNGAILLFHNDKENTDAAIDRVIEELQNQGYSFVTAGELIYREGFSIDANGVQHKN